jgi:hypothetical protein
VKISQKYLTIILTFSFFLFFQMDAEAQCAMCKQAAESSMRANANSMARSLNCGILYLMAVPYLMIMFIFRKQIAQLWRSKFGKPSKNTAE